MTKRIDVATLPVITGTLYPPRAEKKQFLFHF
jgi:hypothetical protein